MKSVKKRFKRELQLIEKSAAELELLCVDISLLETMSNLATKVKLLCERLRLRVDALNKSDFAELIRQDQSLMDLDALTDEDVISVLEGRFSEAFSHCDANQLGELLQQLLEKLEKHQANMLKKIRQLGGILVEAD